jgi:hypothetical protein
MTKKNIRKRINNKTLFQIAKIYFSKISSFVQKSYSDQTRKTLTLKKFYKKRVGNSLRLKLMAFSVQQNLPSPHSLIGYKTAYTQTLMQ